MNKGRVVNAQLVINSIGKWTEIKKEGKNYVSKYIWSYRINCLDRSDCCGDCIIKRKKQDIVQKRFQTSVYKGYKQDKIEMRGDRAEMSDFPLYLNTVAGGLDCRDQTIGGFSFVVKIYAVPVIEVIG